jgi:hypothetical protein
MDLCLYHREAASIIHLEVFVSFFGSISAINGNSFLYGNIVFLQKFLGLVFV